MIENKKNMKVNVSSAIYIHNVDPSLVDVNELQNFPDNYCLSIGYGCDIFFDSLAEYKEFAYKVYERLGEFEYDKNKGSSK